MYAVHKEEIVIDTKWIKRGESLEEAARLLREGKVVAFPTETVYGLGACAMSEEGVRAIYEAKGRPADNPLIVHVYPGYDLTVLVKTISEAGRKLMEAFWPGPLTLSFEKRSVIPDCTTAGLPTVGLRMPSNPVALALLTLSGVPVAAPSANRSGKPSPTTAQHVYEDMNGRIPCIVDGGACEVGLESTFVDMTGELPVILRPGAITKEMLEEVVGPVLVDPAVAVGAPLDHGETPRAPGMKYKHYAPEGDMELVQGELLKVAAYIAEQVRLCEENGRKSGVMVSRELLALLSPSLPEETCVECLGSREYPERMASELFAALRRFDQNGCEKIYGEALPDSGVEAAMMNRMRRAAGGRIVTV